MRERREAIIEANLDDQRTPVVTLESIRTEQLHVVRPTVALGVFDGVHVGHRAILNEAARLAAKIGGTPVAFTFDRHPSEVLGREAPPLLTDLAEKARLLNGYGARLTVVARFDRAFSRLSAENFVRDIIVDLLRARGVVCGFNFRFGCGAEGEPSLLQRLGEQWGFRVSVVEPVTIDGQTVSSSGIRHRLLQGDAETAARWLGRPYRLPGTVERGEGRGRQIGYPTANLLPAAGLLVPGDGVYLARAIVFPNGTTESRRLSPEAPASPAASEGRGNEHPALAIISRKPTFGGRERTVEVHLLDFSGDLYGKPMAVDFLSFMRPIIPFPGVNALVRQIEEDVRRAREHFGL